MNASIFFGRTAALAFASMIALAAAPAHADSKAWQVGHAYEIRFEHLDLSRAGDRAALLKQVETSAARVCRTQQTQARRQACQSAAASKATSAVKPEVRTAIAQARIERDGVRQASN